jgi:hypothetical protein
LHHECIQGLGAQISFNGIVLAGVVFSAIHRGPLEQVFLIWLALYSLFFFAHVHPCSAHYHFLSRHTGGAS